VAALRIALTLQAITASILRCRRVVGITVVIIIAQVVHPRDACTSTEVLRSAKVTFTIELGIR
jgi:hypothetical protein